MLRGAGHEHSPLCRHRLGRVDRRSWRAVGRGRMAEPARNPGHWGGPADFAAQAVRIPIPASAGQFVAGWFKPGQPHGGAVLLLHGVRADRTQTLARARFWPQRATPRC